MITRDEWMALVSGIIPHTTSQLLYLAAAYMEQAAPFLKKANCFKRECPAVFRKAALGGECSAETDAVIRKAIREYTRASNAHRWAPPGRRFPERLPPHLAVMECSRLIQVFEGVGRVVTLAVGPTWGSVAMQHVGELAWHVARLIEVKKGLAVPQDHIVPMLEIARDIIPGHCPLEAVPRTVLAWNDRTVPRIAATVFMDGRCDGMAILSDAAEEAGLDAPKLLAHLRGPGPHWPGCWAVEALRT